MNYRETIESTLFYIGSYLGKPGPMHGKLKRFLSCTLYGENGLDFMNVPSRESFNLEYDIGLKRSCSGPKII